MDDLLEKVIKGLEMHASGMCNVVTYSNGREYCPYWENNDNCMVELLKDAISLLKAQEAPDTNTGKWISVKDRMPVETHSIFWPWYGKKEWSKAMWREQSDKVLVTVKFKDGSGGFVTTGETHDGVWHTTVSRTLEPVITHWKAMPEPPKEE